MKKSNSIKYKVKVINDKDKSRNLFFLDSMIVNKDLLEIRGFGGYYYFLYENIYSFVILTGFGKGLLIAHNVDKYPNDFVVYTNIDPNVILKEFEQIGFTNKKNVIDREIRDFVNEKHNEKDINLKAIIIVSNILAFGLTYLIYKITGHIIEQIVITVFILGLLALIIDSAMRLDR